ncbi:cytochrome o ubiquinol oxidase operon protein cyoD [Pseudochelatococcus lubricantis]|uniref:Cytochrome bo(3) ubiquinol oxidase subunit 4 n=1 Tax=Pseudochelatococcus lubricantis TaxID=1538102 RepID=A0ABX0UXN7_9HYPH|nr:cytochrome o ubiquinol oxidase subunit IV [Pseudochelatococcus lubricantis]NIJ57044.1 cytochrome o ubiquinol oxidase operon protein cyoD [Pseudochelatococcus lubricantis]
MAANPHDAGTVHAGNHRHDSGEAHGTVNGYVTGFVLSAILTVIPFWLVINGTLGSPALTAIAVMALGVAQIVVQMVYFLHMNARSEGGWTLMAFVFTIIIIVIAIAGSMWVMHHLNTHMMPMTPEQAQSLP